MKSERNCYKPYDDIRICNLDEIGISNLETRKTGNLNSTDCVTDDDLFKGLIDTIHVFAKEIDEVHQKETKENNMSKLIKTNLLRKYHNASDCAYATSSVLDYCLNRRHNLLKEFSPLVITKMFLGALYTLLQVIVSLICLITGGFFLFPLYIVQYHFLKKKLVEKYGVDKLNESAEKLAKEFSEVENEKTRTNR